MNTNYLKLHRDRLKAALGLEDTDDIETLIGMAATRINRLTVANEIYHKGLFEFVDKWDGAPRHKALKILTEVDKLTQIG